MVVDAATGRLDEAATATLRPPARPEVARSLNAPKKKQPRYDTGAVLPLFDCCDAAQAEW
ncbi:MAG: hypothetical protein WDO24_22325 [Pseudomonadota bacterium]